MNTHNCLHHSTLVEMLAHYERKAGENGAFFNVLTVLTSLRWILILTGAFWDIFLKYFGSRKRKQESKERTGVKGGRFIARHHQSQTTGKVGARHNHLGSSCSKTMQIPTRRESKPCSSVPMLISLHTVWWRHPHSSPSFFSFFSLACSGGGWGVTLTQFCHGRSHYRSDHFSLTHCKLQAG